MAAAAAATRTRVCSAASSAFGTAGSLVGNFLTGFVLTAYLPVTTIVVAVGGVLLALGAALLLDRTEEGIEVKMDDGA